MALILSFCIYFDAMCFTPILVLEDVKSKRTRNEVSLATFTLPQHYAFLVLTQQASALFASRSFLICPRICIAQLLRFIIAPLFYSPSIVYHATSVFLN